MKPIIALVAAVPIVGAWLAVATVAHAQGSPVSVSEPGASAGVTAFVDVAVLPMDAERVLPGQTVLVAKGRITAMGPTNQVQVPVGATRIEGRGQYLLPGLTDMHVHLSRWQLRDSARVEEWLLQFLAQGVTTVRNMQWTTLPGISEQGLRVRERVARGELVGPRMYTGVRYVGNNTPEDINGKVKAYKAAGYDFIKVRLENRAVVTALTAAGREVGLPVVGHYPFNNSSDWEEAIPFDSVLALGMRSFEHTEVTYALKDTATRAARIAAIRRAGIWVCPTLVTDILRKRSANEKEIVKLLHQDFGVGLLLGTDQFGSVVEELQRLIEAGLTPYQALVTGTRNVAAYLDVSDEAGTIGLGKRADLVLLSDNPFTKIETLQQPAGTMIGGRWFSREFIARRLVALAPAGKSARVGE